MKRSNFPFFSGKGGASYAISAVIITITTITLVLVASSYAYQFLDQQRGKSEFEVTKRSILAFDDGVRDVAWDLKGSRSSRFTVKYGRLELMPDNAIRGLPLAVTVIEHPSANYSDYTGYLRYIIETKYVTLGSEYASYLLGDNKTVVSGVTESFGQALVEQESGLVNITLNYRVRATRTSVVQVGNDTVNYVDIMVIKLLVSNWSPNTGTFDLVAKNIGITTRSYGPYDVVNNECNVKVSLGTSENTTELALDPGKVVFNFVIAEVQVTT